MKLTTLFVLATATLATAQTPPKNPPAGKAPAPATATAANHATLAELTKDFDAKKLAALDAYVKAHASAPDADDALVEAAELAAKLGRHDQTVRYADLFLKDFAANKAAGAMQLRRAGALRDSGDVAGAQKAYEAAIDKAGDDVNLLVEAASTLGDMLVDQGKRDEAVELANVVGASRPQVRGLEEHFKGIAANWQQIGAEPKPLGQPDIAGKAIDLAEYKGKVVLLDFWATWCGPCVAELPNVVAAYEKYHDKGFEIVGISLDQDRAAFDTFVADNKMTWRHQFDGKGWENECAAAYGVRSIPATYLIGQDGKVVAIGLRGEQLEQRLEKLLGKPAKASPASAPKK